PGRATDAGEKAVDVVFGGLVGVGEACVLEGESTLPRWSPVDDVYRGRGLDEAAVIDEVVGRCLLGRRIALSSAPHHMLAIDDDRQTAGIRVAAGHGAQAEPKRRGQSDENT